MLSCFFLVPLDMILLLQLISLLGLWESLTPRWPYLPIVMCQAANLLLANVSQVGTYHRVCYEYGVLPQLAAWVRRLLCGYGPGAMRRRSALERRPQPFQAHTRTHTAFAQAGTRHHHGAWP